MLCISRLVIWEVLLNLARIGVTIVVHRAVDLAGHLVGGLLEFLDALAQALRQFGQLLGPEQNQDDRVIRTISQPPKKPAIRVFISIVFLMVTLGLPSRRVKHQSRSWHQGQTGRIGQTEDPRR